MIDVPRGFISVLDSNGSYIPFFVKVRSDDIIWNDNGIQSLVTSLNDKIDNINVENPTCYSFSYPCINNVFIDNSNIYFKNSTNYNKLALNTFTPYNLAINRDGIQYVCYFRNGDANISTTNTLPHISTIINSFKNPEYTWKCKIDSDGFATLQTSIPITNKVLQNLNDEEKYYCYSNFIFNHTNLESADINLPIPIIYDDNTNIHVSKYSDNDELTNSFIATSFNTTTKIVTNDSQIQRFIIIKKFKIKLNSINNFSENFEYKYRNCKLYITFKGYIPMIKN